MTRPLLRRGRARSTGSVRPVIRVIEPSKEAQAVESKDAAAAIATQLRALIPCSTDPARLEKLAREVESRAHQR
jgi:hypothetical protein